ncbi:hypothetical protein R50072_06240 [Simiduia litorea]|uniref:hypothetical protein n=1 Tax=Simiduia litorea TaxID=1435348 RepID=UPI0036F3506C
MIVFSATHNPTGRAFVGSCRIELDFHWALLEAQAEEGVEGAFFDLIRADGGRAFSVAEYGEAESAKELAELSRDAIDDLDAEPIKLVARQPARLAQAPAKAKDDELLHIDQEADAEDDVDGWISDRREATAKRTASLTVAVPKVTAPSAEESAKKGPLRESKSTTEAAAMKAVMAGIEARRLSQRKSPPKKPAKRGPSARAAQAAAAAPKQESAAARERRIKAALAEQKTQREEAKALSIKAQADEMAAILNRLDERGKVADSIRRRR